MLPFELNLEFMKNTIPSMKYRGGSFIEWQQKAREKLAELLGMSEFKLVDSRVEIEYEKECDDYKEIRFKFQSEEGYFVPCHLLIPANAIAPLPVMICLQGHTEGMNISLGRPKSEHGKMEIIEGDRDFALRVVKEGICALTLEQRNFGECGGTENGPNCFASTMNALLRGRTTIGERAWDVMRLIDVLKTDFAQVDSERIMCMGNSGGGTTTFYVACLEERIKLAMPSCAVCSFDDSIAALDHCSCNYVPNIRNCFDMGDMAGLIAPRKLIIVAGREDSIFPIEGVLKAYETAKEMYDASGNGQNISLEIGNGGHRFYADDAWKTYNRMIMVV